MLISFMALNPQLKSLEVIKCNKIRSQILNRLPNLERIRFDSVYPIISFDEDMREICRLPKLKCLCTDVRGVNILLEAISEYNTPMTANRISTIDILPTEKFHKSEDF